jgi:ABC-type branched-subunit amino acid transport system substrate-binding protein/predicted Ser/Thr protein kinase
LTAPEGIRLGTVLQGRFRVLDVLGRGGFGAVYRCEDLRLPGKHWALKELVCPEPALIDEARRNFEREAHMLSALRHRSLPVIVDYFSEGESTCLLMEEVEGRTLAQVIEEEGPASEGEALRWALELTRVLDYLHSQDPPVIFRDLKPENVMVADDRHLKLIDFGLARHFDPEKRRDTEAIGSVGYAPPEIWEDAAQTDARSDIYSLGATLYFVLTGRPPSPVYGTHSLAPYRPDLSTELETLVLRCMDPEPTGRYGSAVEVIRELLLQISRTDDEPGPSGLSLREEVRQEVVRRPQVSSGPVRVAEAEAPDSLPPGRSQRAVALPTWIPALMTLVTLLFVLGAFLGLRAVWQVSPMLEEEPHAIHNPDKEQARRLLAQGDLRAAASFLDLAVTRYPADAEARILLSNTYALMASSDPIRIPALMSLTGFDAHEGYRLLHGIAAAQDEFNKAGGLDGRHVVFDLYDDGSDTVKILELSEQIFKNPEYLVVLGPFSSQRSLAIAPLFNAARMAFLAPVASDPRLWEAGHYVFTASDSNFPRVRSLAHRLVASGYRTAGIVVDRDSILSSSVAGYFRDQFEGLGGQVVCDTTFAEADFSQALAELREANPDTVLFSDYRGAVLAQFAKELRKAGLQAQIASQTAPFTRDLLAVGGSAVEGLLLSGYYYFDSPRPETQEYVRRFRQLFGSLSTSHLDATAYDATRILLQALANGARDRQSMRDYLASLGTEGGRPPYSGVTGTFALARRLDQREVYLVEVRGGTYRLLEKDFR